jgi:hypothetical protein
MKNFSSILLVLGLLITISLKAQNSPNIETLLERFNENYMGSIYDVFTAEELQLIKDYNASREVDDESFFNSEVLIERRLAGSQCIVPVRVISIDPVNLSELFDFGESPLSEFEGAGFVLGNPTNQAAIIDNTNRLYIRGIQNNNYVDNGLIGNVPAGEIITGTEIVPGRVDQLYGVSTNGTNSSHLLRINTTNFEAEVIGGNNGLILPIALARDAANNLITLDIDDDNVYGINSETGVVNLIGNVGYNANFGQGMAYDPFSDQILSAAYNSSIGDSELRTINPNTGLSVSLGTINPGSISQFGWIAPYDNDVLATIDNELAGFKLYPNPVTSFLNITAHPSIKISSIQIFNMSGGLVFTEGNNFEQLDLSSLNAGLYIMKLETEANIFTKKILKD